jgi:hypothetical protein
MSDRPHRVDIDRLVLTGLAVTPERAEHLRVSLEAELGRLLAWGDWPDRLAGREVGSVAAPAIRLDEHHREGNLTSSLAQSVAQSVRGLGAESKHA